VSDKTVARRLLEMGYSLQLNRKTKEGPQHPNRDAQFRYINRQEAMFRAELTAWQKHTIRGFVSILGKKGEHKIESSKNAEGERTYKITK